MTLDSYYLPNIIYQSYLIGNTYLENGRSFKLKVKIVFKAFLYLLLYYYKPIKKKKV